MWSSIQTRGLLCPTGQAFRKTLQLSHAFLRVMSLSTLKKLLAMNGHHAADDLGGPCRISALQVQIDGSDVVTSAALSSAARSS